MIWKLQGVCAGLIFYGRLITFVFDILKLKGNVENRVFCAVYGRGGYFRDGGVFQPQ